MNEMTKRTVYLEEYDIIVNCYLLPAQIQQIANAVANFKTWAEREQNIVMLTLFHATNIEKEQLEHMGVNAFIESGLFEVVKNSIVNFYELKEAIEYEESFSKNVSLVLEKAGPQINELLEMVSKRYGKSSTKK